MKEIQTPLMRQKTRSSALINRRSQDDQTKKLQRRELTKKNLSTEFASVDGDDDLPNIFDEASEISNITACDDDLIDSFALPETFTPCSKESIVTVDERNSESKATSPVEVELTLHCLRKAQSQLQNSVNMDCSSKELLDALIEIILHKMYPIPDETDRVLEIVQRKYRVICCCFLVWILAVFTVLIFASGNDSSYIGVVPT